MRKKISIKQFIFIYSLVFSISFLGILYYLNKKNPPNPIDEAVISSEELENSVIDTGSQTEVEAEDNIGISPIDRAEERVTKKPFGLYVSPAESPVQPERFSGYHTATDFEIFPDEEELEVAVYSICEGELEYSGTINGYGGVMVLACQLDGEAVRVIYGHLDIEKASYRLGDLVTTDKQLAVLAPAYSNLSGGERKHLHLGVLRGETIDWRGYVNNESDLERWYDPLELMRAGAFKK